MHNIASTLFDGADHDPKRGAYGLMHEMVQAAAKEGSEEYRTRLLFPDIVALCYGIYTN